MKPIIVVSELTGEYYIATRYRKTAGHIVAQTKYLITREELQAVGLTTRAALERLADAAEAYGRIYPPDEAVSAEFWAALSSVRDARPVGAVPA